MTEQSSSLERLTDLELTTIVRDRPWEQDGQAATVEIWRRYGRTVEQFVNALSRRRRPYWVAEDDFREQLHAAVKVKLLSGRRGRRRASRGGAEDAAATSTEDRVLGRFEARGPLEGFLKTVCRTVALDLVRHLGVRQENGVITPPPDGYSSLDSNSVPDPVAHDGQRQVAIVVERCLETLTADGALEPRKARVLRLRYWFGCEWDEIAVECEIGVRQVQRWCRDAKEVLRGELLKRGIAGLEDVELLERRYVRNEGSERPGD